MNKRILIIGDGGRGKSTFAEKLSKKTGIPFYSIDDFFWKTKFSEPRDKQESIQAIEKVYEKEEWIVEGGSRPLIKTGLEKADIIYHLKFKSIIPQYFFLIKRSLKRDNETWTDLWKLLKHVTYKKCKKGYGNHMPTTEEMIKPYEGRIITLHTHKEIRAELNKFDVKDLVKIYIEDENGKILKTHFLRVDEWGVPSGKIEEGESPKQAAIRELLERTGYEINENDLLETGIEGDFIIFKGNKSSLIKVAEPGEKGGYSTEIKWE